MLTNTSLHVLSALFDTILTKALGVECFIVISYGGEHNMANNGTSTGTCKDYF